MSRKLYLALGDSITAGFNASHPGLSFVSHVADFTKRKKLSEQTLVVARNGWTTKDVWNAAQLVSPTVWNNTNVLTLMTGGNDLRQLLRRQYLSFSGAAIPPQLVHRRLEEFRLYMTRLCDFIQNGHIPYVIIATVYNPAPKYPLAVEALEGLNAITREIAQKHKFGVVDVYKKFRGNEAYFIDNYRTGRFEDLISPIRRPIHPNNTGHKQIADLITAHLMRKMNQSKRRVR